MIKTFNEILEIKIFIKDILASSWKANLSELIIFWKGLIDSGIICEDTCR